MFNLTDLRQKNIERNNQFLETIGLLSQKPEVLVDDVVNLNEHSSTKPSGIERNAAIQASLESLRSYLLDKFIHRSYEINRLIDQFLWVQ
jgi:hypothetical protein